MFISKSKYDECEARKVQLAREVRELSNENKALKELRRATIRNNTMILEENRQLIKTIKEIKELATRNTYGNSELNLRKIKELATTTIN